MKCERHPQYEAKRRGRSGCVRCWLIYWLVRIGIVKPTVTRRRGPSKAKVAKVRAAYDKAVAEGKVHPTVEHPALPGIETATPADEAAIEKVMK